MRRDDVWQHYYLASVCVHGIARNIQKMLSDIVLYRGLCVLYVNRFMKGMNFHDSVQDESTPKKKGMKVPPYVDCRLGLISDFDDTVIIFSPNFGVDIDRFSVFGQFTSIDGANIFSLGAAWNFR